MPPRWLLGAAAALIVIGGGGTALRMTTAGSDDSAATSAGADSAGGSSSAESAAGADSGTGEGAAALAALGPVLSTGTNYRKADLEKQVKALVTASDKATVQADKAPGSRTSASPSGADLLRSPAALQACLAAIDAEGVRPIAVDLARYAGRDAALIVLPAVDGKYEVWAVARDCRADADGAIDVATVKR
jgi:hypothetical protein